MTEIYNTSAHYTNNPKVESRKPMIATSPAHVPNRYIFTDEEAKKRLQSIDDSIKKIIKLKKIKKKEIISNLFLLRRFVF